MKASLTEERKKNNWVVPLCSCCSYVDKKGSLRRGLACQAMLCTNVLLGKTYTRLNREPEICLQMGPVGCCLCCINIPFSVNHPMGSVCCMGFSALAMREEIIKRYNVTEENACSDCCICCCFTHRLCNTFHYGCNYPCTFFQMLVSMEEWDHEIEYGTSVLPNGNPSETTFSPIVVKGTAPVVAAPVHATFVQPSAPPIASPIASNTYGKK